MTDWMIVIALCAYASAYVTAVLRRGNRLVRYGGQAAVSMGYLVVLAPMTLIGHKASWTRRTFRTTWARFCTSAGKALGELVRAAAQAVKVLGEWARWSWRTVRQSAQGRQTTKVR